MNEFILNKDNYQNLYSELDESDKMKEVIRCFSLIYDFSVEMMISTWHNKGWEIYTFMLGHLCAFDVALTNRLVLNTRFTYSVISFRAGSYAVRTDDNTQRFIDFIAEIFISQNGIPMEDKLKIAELIKSGNMELANELVLGIVNRT